MTLLPAAAGFAQADRADEQTQASGKPLWEVGAGLAFAGYPDFRGSDEYNYVGLPIPIVIYRGNWLRVSRGDARARLFESRRLKINVNGGGTLPADSDRANGRKGMPDLDPTFSVGPSFDWTLSNPDDPHNRLRLRLPVRAAFVASFDDFDTLGVIIQPSLVYDHSWQRDGRSTTLSLKAGPLWASTRYHDYFYTVKPEDATPDRPAYKASGGYSGVSAGAGIIHRRDRLSVGGYLSADYLKGATFDDSPLIATQQSYLVGAFIAWRFWQSDARAPTPDREDNPYD